MQNIRKLINTIRKTQIPITIRKYDYSSKIQLVLAQPYDVIGLNVSDWMAIKNTIFQYWNGTDDEILNAVTDTFNSLVVPRYLEVLESILPQIVLPTIVVSILVQTSQYVNAQSLSSLDPQDTDIQGYISYLTTIMMRRPISYSPVKRYVVDLDVDPAYMNMQNGVSEIIWGNLTELAIDQTYGLQHIWDHYDYFHVHSIPNFESHKYLLLNAIKRTWIASLEVVSGVKSSHTRVNYGYRLHGPFPPYTSEQYAELGKLNLGTVITTGYDINRIKAMSFDEIEILVKQATKCLRLKPSLNVVYITSKQLAQERLLGNAPITNRYHVMVPITYAGERKLYNTYITRKLPVGDAFDEKIFKRSVELTQKTVTPSILPYVGSATVPIGDQTKISHSDKTILIPREYVTYLDILKIQTQNQYLNKNIKDFVTKSGYDIVNQSEAVQIISFMILNNSDGFMLQDGMAVPNTIFEEDVSGISPDYSISIDMLSDVFLCKQALDMNYNAINVCIVNSSVLPTTFVKLMRFNQVPLNLYSLTGDIGAQIDSLFSFSLMNSTILYLAILETDYLNDVDGFDLFTTDIHENVLYSLEFINFSSSNLAVALTSLISSIKLITGKNSITFNLLPTLLQPYSVGIRFQFSINEEFIGTSTVSNVSEIDLVPFCRNISIKTVAVDPVQSLVYPSTIVPRVGSMLLVACQSDELQQAVGYVASLSRYTKVASYSSTYTYYEVQGVVDQSRIACLDRLKMFRTTNEIVPSQLIPQEINFSKTLSLTLTYFEIVTNTDRLLLYLLRKEQNLLKNNLSDYGSADFLNLIMTDSEYTMYDIDIIDIADVPGVSLVPGMLPWGEKLPYIVNNDVLIYNSLFLNARVADDDMSVPIIAMLAGVLESSNIYFNLPFVSDELYGQMKNLNIVTKRSDRYWIKLSTYPEVPCLTQSEFNKVIAALPTPQWNLTILEPTLLDYYFTSRMIQRQAANNDYFNALSLHKALPLIQCSKS